MSTEDTGSTDGADRIITTSELWPLIADALGMDPDGKHITSLTLIVKQPIPVVRVEYCISTGQALSLRTMFEDYNLTPKKDTE